MEIDRKVNGELGQLGLQIRKKRFESYNQVWLNAAAQNESYSQDDEDNNEDMVTLGHTGNYVSTTDYVKFSF